MNETKNNLWKYFGITFAFSLFSVSFCLPLGLIAIYFGTRIMDEKAYGNTELALTHYKKMKTFMWIAYAIGIIQYMFFMVFMVLGAFQNRRILNEKQIEVPYESISDEDSMEGELDTVSAYN